MTVKELADATREIAQMLEYEAQTLEEYHAYAQMFELEPGSNIFEQVLADALAHRGSDIGELHAAMEDTEEVQ